MNQQVVAVTVHGSHNFVCSNDEHGKIMIFSLGTDGIYLCKEDQAGVRVIINLSSDFNAFPSHSYRRGAEPYRSYSPYHRCLGEIWNIVDGFTCPQAT